MSWKILWISQNKTPQVGSEAVNISSSSWLAYDGQSRQVPFAIQVTSLSDSDSELINWLLIDFEPLEVQTWNNYYLIKLKPLT